MQNTHIHQRRIRQFIDRVVERRYGACAPLEVRYTYDPRRPIPVEEIKSRKWKSISPGTRWGELWGSAWFRISGTVPAELAGAEVVALVNLGAEGAVFRNGYPYRGLTDPPRGGDFGTGKRRIPLFAAARGGENVELVIEAGANALFGYHGHQEFVLHQAELAVFNRDLWQIGLDLDFLYDLYVALPERSVRARRILASLDEAANVWADGRGAQEVRTICARLLKPRASASATTVWSVGHAHLDLGWLWPVRETRRKAGRTFATALRMLEEYPDYVFGASQPQAFDWVKRDYPALYEEVKQAVAKGRFECQGAMWVEPDMNITGGESLVRQLLFGKRFFREEFGKDVRNLWLPDVFGYSAALPQILKRAGVDVFMTQKISWNETNTFPHHTFDWEGIDGTRIRTHFLPMNTYNATNAPGQLVSGEERYAQADVCDDWLNLYGIGDGGGGPSRRHIEYALRAANTEGLPKVTLARAEQFFAKVAKIPGERLPLWRGELYLELHRGTYTTQGRMKQLNRRLELTLRDAEYLAALAGIDQREATEVVWKELLLNQFHDILPGSSITLVYEEANAQAERNLGTLEQLKLESLSRLHGRTPRTPRSWAVHNSLSWQRRALIELPFSGDSSPIVRDAARRTLATQIVEGGLLVAASIPAMGYTSVSVEDTAARTATAPARGAEAVRGVRGSVKRLENELVRVRLASDGTIASIYDKEHGREVLADGANRLLLWEDLPYSWDAWDISHYYRDTTPQQAVLSERTVLESGPLRAVVEQMLTVGNSSIRQRIVLEAESRMVRVENHVEWNESHKQLRVQAVPAIHALEADYEIQYGTVRRPAHGNTSWDAAQFEVAGQRFADYSQDDYGLGLVNDCKYGHYIRDGVMELTLLRSPKDPDPVADIGEHEFTFGYYPHTGGWQESDLLERSHELNSPVIVHPIATAVDAPVSELALCCGDVKIEVVKRAEDSEATILRLYETRGRNHEVRLRSRRAVKRIEEVNLLEEEPAKVSSLKACREDGFGSEVSLAFGPYQIRSFRITFAPEA